ncbi:MAG: fused response regulator/phosphatase [Deltaproteobacteria bacterium]|nr:fused response regulator/phosphatase [Deltaproteobacteria bacterium]
MTMPALRQHRIVVLLIDDQRIVGEAVRRMLAAESDIALHHEMDPAQAVTRAAELEPTVILQDLVMPGIDGLTLLRTFRDNEATRQVPLIVLSSKEEPKTKAEAFALGASDYLVKLPDKVELVARIRHHSNAHIAALQRNEAYAALVASQQALAAELAEAADYVRSLLPPPLRGPITTAWEFVSSTSLGGDGLGYGDLDADHFAMFLLDVTGHGVGAALLSVSAMHAITAQTLPGVDFRDPVAVLGGLNDAFPMERHNNMYFTIWYGVLHRPSRTLRYASAGHPPAVVLADGHAPQRLRTEGMPVGSLPDLPFASATATLPPRARLYLCSDGAYEITRPDGGMMRFDEFVALLAARGEPDGAARLAAVVAAVRAEQGKPTFEDDLSLLELVIE